MSKSIRKSFNQQLGQSRVGSNEVTIRFLNDDPNMLLTTHNYGIAKESKSKNSNQKANLHNFQT